MVIIFGFHSQTIYPSSVAAATLFKPAIVFILTLAKTFPPFV
jgi:hypothetical protein